MSHTLFGRASSTKTQQVLWALLEAGVLDVELEHASAQLGSTSTRYGSTYLNATPFPEGYSEDHHPLRLAPSLVVEDRAPLFEANAITRFVVRTYGPHLLSPDATADGAAVDDTAAAFEAAGRDAWLDVALCLAPTEDTGEMGKALHALIDHSVRLPPEARSNADFCAAEVAFCQALGVVEAHLGRTQRDHLGGSAFGLGDFALGVMVSRWLWARDTRAATGFPCFDEASYREKLVADREAAVAQAKEDHAAQVEAAEKAGKEPPEPPQEPSAEEAAAADDAAVAAARLLPREKLPLTCAWVGRLLARPAFAEAVWAREAAHHGRPVHFFAWR